MDQDDLFNPARAPRPNATRSTVIGVSELNRRVRSLIEANLELLWVAGELSNVVRAASGHWYFSLKDHSAQVRCVMFRTRAAGLAFNPANGLQVEVRALPSLYEARGDFQLGVEAMRPAGLGALFEAYERLKSQLAARGWFDEHDKKPLPAFPRSVGVVTSLQAAALRDVLSTLARRAPMIRVIIYPTSVQGAGAALEIARALDRAAARNEVDALIICRGGGSIEDLWPFNEEVVAQAVKRLRDQTSIPIVSGIGHETDFTICDFVADCRAPTPTAAAELLSPLRAELLTHLAITRARMQMRMRQRLENAQQRVDQGARSLLSPQQQLARLRDRLTLLGARLTHVNSRKLAESAHSFSLLHQRMRGIRPPLENWRKHVDHLRSVLRQSLHQQQARRRQEVEHLGIALQHLSPHAVLSRGYSIVSIDGSVLLDAARAPAGSAIDVRLAHGELHALVTRSSAEAGEAASNDP